jgi:hypothetical protein
MAGSGLDRDRADRAAVVTTLYATNHGCGNRAERRIDYAWAMSRRTRAPATQVTGVATGNLGTGTALDDTQVYSVDALAAADDPEADQPVAELPDVVASRDDPPIEPQLAAPAVVPATRPQRVQGRGRVTGGYPVGFLVAAVVALIAVAAVLTMRDGGLVGGNGTGSGFAGAASFPPEPSFGTIATAAPAKPATGNQGHGGHGHGHGPR